MSNSFLQFSTTQLVLGLSLVWNSASSDVKESSEPDVAAPTLRVTCCSPGTQSDVVFIINLTVDASAAIQFMKGIIQQRFFFRDFFWEPPTNQSVTINAKLHNYCVS